MDNVFKLDDMVFRIKYGLNIHGFYVKFYYKWES